MALETIPPAWQISIIQGDGGEGKTTLALAIAAAISNGDALPGGRSSAPAHVIVHNSEDGLTDTIYPRLEQLGADAGRVHFIDDGEDSLTFVDGRIEQSIVQTGAKLIILDPVQAYFGTANMNAAGSVRLVMKRLAAVAARHKCAVLLVGHLGKKGGKAAYKNPTRLPNQKIRSGSREPCCFAICGLGSIDIYAAARSVMTVGRLDADEDTRAIVHGKSNLAPPGTSQAFSLDPLAGFTWLGEYDITLDELIGGKRQPENQLFKARRLIETALMKDAVAAVDIMEMVAEQGISEKTIKRAKSELGVISIKRGGKWYWEMPIDVEYTEVGHQEGHATMSRLTLLLGGRA